MENTTKETRPADKQNPILSDEAIRDLSDLTPFSEGDPVGFMVDGEPVCGFWEAAEQVAGAAPVEAAKLRTGQARALFHMRSFYLMGVQRGAEAYRSLLTDEDEMKELPFDLDAYAADGFREDLEQMPPEQFRRLCALLGLSVEWEEQAKGGVAIP